MACPLRSTGITPLHHYKETNLSAGTPLAGERSERHIKAKVSQTFDQAFGLLAFGSVLKVIGAEVLIQGSVLEHVIDCGEDGGSDGHDRLLRAAPRLDAQELGLQVAILLAYRRPGALHECGLEPGRTLSQAVGPTFSGTLVVARAKTDPRDEMAFGWETAHVGANLRDDDLRADFSNAGDCHDLADSDPKRCDACLHLLVDRGNGRIESIDLI